MLFYNKFQVSSASMDFDPGAVSSTKLDNVHNNFLNDPARSLVARYVALLMPSTIPMYSSSTINLNPPLGTLQKVPFISMWHLSDALPHS
ncbi:hypothetical protein TNCV_3856021 [Trichonephila clavipes]|nr:hypothetical protein TNCV_3856021 [Trichonephila clavipes]